MTNRVNAIGCVELEGVNELGKKVADAVNDQVARSQCKVFRIVILEHPEQNNNTHLSNGKKH